MSKSVNPPGTFEDKNFAGISIMPLAQNSYFNARKEPNVNASIVQKVNKAVPGNGLIWKDKDGRFWVGVNTPSGPGWVRSDVASWQGKTTNTNPTASNPKQNVQLLDDFLPAFKGKSIGFLAQTSKVNFRSRPEIIPSTVIQVFDAKNSGRKIGEGTGNIKRIPGSNVFWIEMETNSIPAKKGWVRSDVVYHSGPVNQWEVAKEKVVEKSKDVAETVKETASSTFLAIKWLGIGVLVMASGVLDGVFKKGRS